VLTSRLIAGQLIDLKVVFDQLFQMKTRNRTIKKVCVSGKFQIQFRFYSTYSDGSVSLLLDVILYNMSNYFRILTGSYL